MMAKPYVLKTPSHGEEPLAIEMAWFPYMKSRTPTVRRLGEVLDDIQKGEWRTRVCNLRALRIEHGEEAYKREKEKLPSFYISGTAATPTKMLTHSGMIQVDLDDLDDMLTLTREEAIKDPHVVAVFVSPGGEGLKILVRLEPLDEPLNKDEHKRAFAAVSTHFTKHYGVTPDPSCSNVNRHCLVSYDPNLFRNPSAIAFPWKSKAFECEGGERGSSSSNTPLLQDFNPTELPNYHTTPHHPHEVEMTTPTDALVALKFQQEIELSHPRLWTQYLRLVDRRHEARGGKRNAMIIEAVPFLYRALSTPMVRLYMEWFYRANANVFTDTLEQHMDQVESMLRGVEFNYAEGLSTTERRFWSVLKERGRASFRIARDLALITGPNAPAPPEFFLSGESLAERHGLFRKDGRPQDETGARELRMLVQFGVIEIVKPGQRRMADTRGVSTRYRWRLPTQ